jgi:ankyrin repeat protein
VEGFEHALHFVATGMSDLRQSYDEAHGRRVEEGAARQVAALEVLLDTYTQRVTLDDSIILQNRLLLLVSSSPGKTGAMKMLLGRGADPNIQDAANGRTPLHYAVMERRDLQRCNEEGVALLLAHGARADLKDRRRLTAVDLARKYGDESTVRRLESLV